MEKIDIEKMGQKEVVHETNGIVITSFDSIKAAKEIAEKVNEIVAKIAELEEMIEHLATDLKDDLVSINEIKGFLNI